MQKVSVILIATLIAALGVYLVSEGPQIDEFSQWKAQFGRHYDSAGEVYRRAIFAQNRAAVEAHNANPAKSYQMGLTQFADLSQREFEAYYLTALIVPEGHRAVEQDETNAYVHKLGDVDWAAQGAVTTVKNEGSKCGACWAFSSIGPLESLSKIKDGNLKTFSEQQLIDCSSKYGNYGCNGGWMTTSFKFVSDNGISLQSEYPYVGVAQKCQKETGSFKITGFSEAKNCNQLANLITKGTVSVAVNAISWSSYKSGILDNCSSTNLNFAAVLVGANSSYWKVKNAWGTAWGQNGYIRLAPGDTCGICQMASIPYK